jgi:DNA-binding transcriptional ArsR family regulator
MANLSSHHLDVTFAALADPTRRAILARLAQGETSVKELSRPFSISAPSITKHLKVLERAGLITRSRDAQWRPCRLEAAPLKSACEWVERYRAYWEQSLNKLDAYVAQLQVQEEKKNARKRKS